MMVERLVQFEYDPTLHGLVENRPNFSESSRVRDQNEMLESSCCGLRIEMMGQLLGKRRFVGLAWR